MLECVVNISEGRREDLLEDLAAVCGPSLLDLHADPDHHRSVFTLAGPRKHDAELAARELSRAAAAEVDLKAHDGVHPRLGVIDVVPFVSLDEDRVAAVHAAQSFARWIAEELSVPAFLYDDADPLRRSLPELRRDAFALREPDVDAPKPNVRLGAVAVGARPPLVAINCELDRDDPLLTKEIARALRESEGGLPGVRALGLWCKSRDVPQVSMNLVDLPVTSVEAACTEVRRRAEEADAQVTRVELVGLLPAAELERCSDEFLAWSGLGPDDTVEARLADQVERWAAGSGREPAPSEDAEA
jgi:glutamate formiminotransferase